MESKEYLFKGLRLSGFLMLFVSFLVLGGSVFAFVTASDVGLWLIPVGIVGVLLFILILVGLMMVEPNDARVMVFFGKYKGTFKENGYFWVNPFYTKNKLTLRARNLDAAPIKVNDKNGNPIMIGLVLVWRVNDTYRCMFEIDSSSINSAQAQAQGVGYTLGKRMKAYEDFVRIQSDAALRGVAGTYAYDYMDNDKDGVTLRSGGEEVTEKLEVALNERLAIAGIEVVEARINYLAYAPEIASTMLRRQQAAAIISAREKIVEGAVSMVEMALRQLSEKGIVELDNDKKAAMVGNLLVVLCADEPVQPVVNTSSVSV